MGGFRNPLVDVGFLITLAILAIPWLLFHKRILRAFLGGRTPLILAKRSSEPFAHGWQPKIAWGVGLLAGAAIGFAMSALTAGPEADSGSIIIMSAICGAGTAGTILEWKRTLLAEYLFEIPLFGWAVVVVGTTQGEYPIFPVALLGGAACVSAVVAAGFFIRWRRWIKSLPESVTMEQA
jgi:hypothetical protein